MSTGRWATASFPRGGAYIEIQVPPTADLALAAVAPRALAGVRVDVPAAGVVLAALIPRAVAGGRVGVPAADVALASAVPRAVAGVRVDAPAASAIVLAGVAPRVVAGSRVAVPAADTVAIAAATPTLRVGARVGVPAGDIIIAGAAPRAAAGTRTAVPAADIALTGATPTLGLSVGVPAAGIAVAGLAPSLRVGTKVAVPRANIIIDALVPALGVIELTRPDIIYAASLAAAARGWGLVDRLPARGEAPPGYADIERVYVSESIYVATQPFVTEADDSPASTPFAGRLSSLALRRSIQTADRFGGVADGDGTLIIDNVDGRYDARLFQAVAGDVITIKAGTLDQKFANWRTIFRGTARDQEFDDRQVRVLIRDDAFRLDVPIQDSLYAGSGGAEGDDTIANKPKPLLLGRRANIQPVQVSFAYQVYQIHDGAIDIVFGVRDRGTALTFDGDYATYAALIAATVASSHYATCLAEGFVRLGSTPAGQVTADAATYRSTGAAPLATVVRGALEDYGPITSFDEAGFTEMGGYYPGDHGIFVSENDNWTIRETIEKLLLGCAAYVFFRRDGRCQIGRVRAPTGAALRVFGTRDIIGEVSLMRLPSGLSPPPWRMRGLYAANDTVQTDLAGSADQLYRQPGKVAVAQDSNVLFDYALAQDPPPFDTCMTNGTLAGSEISRQLTIYKDPLPLRRAKLPRNAINAEIGDIVDLANDRLGGQRRQINVEDNIAVGDGLDTVELVLYG